MANVDRPNGLRPVGTGLGAPWNGKVNMYVVESANDTAIFVGDLVKLNGTAGEAGETSFGLDVEGMPEIIQAAAGNKAVGVVVGFLPNQDNLMQKHCPSETRRVALVSDDPNTVYEIQEVSGGTALTSAAVGLNVDVVVAAGNTVTGNSGMELDNSTEAADAALNFQILGLVKRVDNAIGEHAKWLVKVSDHEFSVGQTGTS
jgi:hypothetical protein